MAFEILPTGDAMRQSNYEKLKSQLAAFVDDSNAVWDSFTGGMKGQAKTAFESLANWNAKTAEEQCDHLFVVNTAMLILLGGLMAEIDQLKSQEG